MPYRALDLGQARIASLDEWPELLQADDLAHHQAIRSGAPELGPVAERIAAVRRAGRPVIGFLGAEAVTAGLRPLLVDLLRRGLLTHIAMSGAAASRDFALVVSSATAAGLHQAIRDGARAGLGLGEALGCFLAGHEGEERELSVLYQAYRLAVPITIHVTIGADALSLAAGPDLGALGFASGQDFRVLCASLADPAGGMLVNLGWSDTGLEVLSSALATIRSLELDAGDFTTAGIAGPLDQNLAALHAMFTHVMGSPAPGEILTPQPATTAPLDPDEMLAAVEQRSAAAAEALQDLTRRHPALQAVAGDLARAYLAIARSLDCGGTLFLCGNGGSFSDALHISGEMLKSYARPRPIPAAHRSRLAGERNGEVLAANLERGLRAIVLGANPALNSAVSNDFSARDLSYAQELYALARPGDAFLGISTSGKAANVGNAASVARALGLTTIALTGPDGGPLAAQVDVPIRAPGARTDRIQEQHVVLYHTLCEMLEVDLCLTSS